MPKTYRVEGTDYQFPDDFSEDKVQSILTKQGIIKPPPMGFGQRMLQTGVGMAKGLGSTAAGAAELGRQMSGGALQDVIAPGQAKTRSEGLQKFRQLMAPTNPSQEAGFKAEQLGEYLVPLGEEKIAASVPKGLRLLTRMAVNAGRTGATAAAQAGGDPKAGIVPAAAAAGGTAAFEGAAKTLGFFGKAFNPFKLYQGAVKLPSGISIAERDRILKSGLEHGIVASEPGYQKLVASINELSKRINSEVAAKSRELSGGAASEFKLLRQTTERDALEGVGGGVGPGVNVFEVPVSKIRPLEDISGDASKIADAGRYAKMKGEPPALFGHYDPTTGEVTITSGSRRLLAAQQAGRQTLPVAIPGGGKDLGGVIDPKVVTDRLDAMIDHYTKQAYPESDIATIRQVRDSFLKRHSYEAPYTKIRPSGEPELGAFTPEGQGSTTVRKPLTLNEAQIEKQGTYRFNQGGYGKLGGAQLEAEKTIARTLREQITSLFPEVEALNKDDKSMIELEEQLRKFVVKEGNKSLVPLKAAIVGASGLAGALMPGTDAREGGTAGLLLGTAVLALDNPEIKSKLAIALAKSAKMRFSASIGSAAARGVGAAVSPKNQLSAPDQQ